MSIFDALTQNSVILGRPEGADILGRTKALGDWVSARRGYKIWPFSTTITSRPQPETEVIREDLGGAVGLNFASQDYLSLTSHPAVVDAAKEALDRFGPHSAGAGILQGNTSLSRLLEQALGDQLKMEHIVLYPTGWGAGYGAITGLVQPEDFIIMDEFAHACLQAGAAAATRNIIRHRHLQTDEVPTILANLRHRKDHKAGILVVTEGLFSMDADIPALGPLQHACRDYTATLLVDVAHDFGALGPGGTGAIGIQGLLGQVDLVMGSFSKTFASNGGFVATNLKSVRDFLCVYSSPHTFSNALSPIQTAVVLKCLDIVRSEEGQVRRARLMKIAQRLRGALAKRQVTTLGDPSPIVPALLGEEKEARLASRHLFDHQVFANLVEFPGVAPKRARFRLQVMSDHTEAQADRAAAAVADAIASAKAEIETMSARRS